jgi:hypothetical protein
MPLAAKLEEGSELYASMATVIVGGMLSSTVLSLLVVPCMYTYFDDLEALLGRLVSWRPFRARGHGAAEPGAHPAAEPVPHPQLEEAGSRT